MEKLAIDGGAPVRAEALYTAYPGGRQIGEREIAAVNDVLRLQSPFRYYGPSPKYTVEHFERAFAEKIGVRFALGVTSGTAALIVALKGLGVGPGDLVLVPSRSFVASAGAIVAAGAVPVFAEIDETLNLDPAEIDRLYDPRMKAVMAVALRGDPCRMDEIVRRAHARGLKVLEDVAQSCGSSYHGKMSGAFGDAGAFSLQLNKIISSGDGGACVTDDPAVYERMVRFHDQGSFRRRALYPEFEDVPPIEMFGQNYRMNEMTGAVAGVQLERLDDILRDLRARYRYIMERIADVPGLTIPPLNDPDGFCGSNVTLLLPTREQTLRFCAASAAEGVAFGFSYDGIPTYKIPFVMHQRTADERSPFTFVDPPVRYYDGMCPRSERLCARSAALFLDPTYSFADCDDAVAVIRKCAAAIL